MDFGEFQREARVTDQNPKGGEPASPREALHSEVVPLLGLVGEVGALLSEYKKLLRDGKIHRKFRDEVAEELGDVLWYVANVADKFDLQLEDIANQNLAKCRGRWLSPSDDVRFYDDELDSDQQLPRYFKYRFVEEKAEGIIRVRMFDASSGKQTGDPLRDNTYDDDGYRFHDVIHLAFAAHLGWSPVFRKLLRTQQLLSHRTPEKKDDAEDGGRAQVVEEAIVLASYIYAEDHAMLDGASTVGPDLLRHVQTMTRNLEVQDRSAWEWDQAFLNGFEVWRELIDHRGGTVSGELAMRHLRFES